MSNTNKVDCALLPPCGKTLRNKIQRAHYMSIIWGNADSTQPAEGLDPLHYGWATNKEGHYVPEWFPGPVEPDNLFSDAVTSEQTTQLSDDIDDPADHIDNDSQSDPEWSDDSDCEIEGSNCLMPSVLTK